MKYLLWNIYLYEIFENEIFYYEIATLKYPLLRNIKIRNIYFEHKVCLRFTFAGGPSLHTHVLNQPPTLPISSNQQRTIQTSPPHNNTSQPAQVNINTTINSKLSNKSFFHFHVMLNFKFTISLQWRIKQAT